MTKIDFKNTVDDVVLLYSSYFSFAEGQVSNHLSIYADGTDIRYYIQIEKNYVVGVDKPRFMFQVFLYPLDLTNFIDEYLSDADLEPYELRQEKERIIKVLEEHEIKRYGNSNARMVVKGKVDADGI